MKKRKMDKSGENSVKASKKNPPKTTEDKNRRAYKTSSIAGALQRPQESNQRYCRCTEHHPGMSRAVHPPWHLTPADRSSSQCITTEFGILYHHVAMTCNMFLACTLWSGSSPNFDQQSVDGGVEEQRPRRWNTEQPALCSETKHEDPVSSQ